MSNFRTAKAKLYIVTHDPDMKDAPKVEAQYNPEGPDHRQEVPWSKHSYTNKGNDMAYEGPRSHRVRVHRRRGPDD